MRSLNYLAFGLAFLGAQACTADDAAPPPLPASGQASTDNPVNDDERVDPGSDDPEPLEPEQGTPLPPAACSVTYTKNILPKIKDQWRCGASDCHGKPTVNKPVMDTKNADATYTLLTTFVHQGKKLVNTTSANPADSALYCLMQGTCGPRMPRQGVDPLDLALLESWLKCKSPRGSD